MPFRKKRYSKYLILLLVFLMMVAAALPGCSSQKEDPMADVRSYKDLNDPSYTIGVINGTIDGPVTEKLLPKAKVAYFSTLVDNVTALESGKADAIVDDDVAFIYYNVQAGEKLRILDDYMEPFEFGYIFPKTDEGRKLRDQVSDFTNKLSADGTLDEIRKNWISSEGSAEMTVDYASLPAENGTIRMATTGTSPPFSYIENGAAVGYDIDVISRFCKEYGYALEVNDMNFDGIIPSVSSGKCDLGGSALTITDERKESVEFSAPYYSGGLAAAVLSPKAAGGSSLFGRLRESFAKTFIKEGRYRLFVSGILTTLLITILSALFGTLLGFLVYLLCRNGNRFANAVTKVCVRLLQMLPVVVLLMILYYIVFSSAPVSGTFVSVIAFTLTFAASVFGNLTSSVSAIDYGQTEAAYALGFSSLRTFFKVVLPQALAYFLPAYKSDLVALIKATAVVGYIAVQDLTRTGDIVRSRTYEAFFPLIAVAVLYLIMALILIALVDRLEIRTDPKRRKREYILKGVKTDD